MVKTKKGAVKAPFLKHLTMSAFFSIDAGNQHITIVLF